MAAIKALFQQAKQKKNKKKEMRGKVNKTEEFKRLKDEIQASKPIKKKKLVKESKSKDSYFKLMQMENLRRRLVE